MAISEWQQHTKIGHSVQVSEPLIAVPPADYQSKPSVTGEHTAKGRRGPKPTHSLQTYEGKTDTSSCTLSKALLNFLILL